MSRLDPFINVINPITADYAYFFWYMNHGCPQSFQIYRQIETGSTVLFKTLNARHAIAFNKRWYDTHPLPT